MKKMKFLLVATCLLASASAFAQSNYNRVYASYAPLRFSAEFQNVSASHSYTGFGVGYTKGISISRQMPLFLEVGGKLNYNSGDYNLLNYGDEGYLTDKVDYKFVSVAVPVNVAYKIQIPSVKGLSITPYVGARLKCNIIGSMELDGEKADIFKKDDMEGDPAKRIQLGGQAGVNLSYKNLYLGVEYAPDFTNLYSTGGAKLKTSVLSASIGLNF